MTSEYQRNRIERLRSQGLCERCGHSPVVWPHRSLCNKCRSNIQAYRRKRYAQWKEDQNPKEWLCKICNKPSMVRIRRKDKVRLGSAYCLEHWQDRCGERYEVGTRKVDINGYVLVKVGRRWHPEHRIVMEQTLGRKLLPRIETVHHKNGVRSDNEPDNLELWVTPQRFGQRAIDIRCPHCGEPWLVQHQKITS